MAPPANNVNAQRSGISRLLTVGQFPRGGAYLRRSVQLLKVEIETDLARRGVAIGLGERATINAICVHEGVRLLLWRYLRRSGGDDADGQHEPDGDRAIDRDGSGNGNHDGDGKGPDSPAVASAGGNGESSPPATATHEAASGATPAVETGKGKRRSKSKLSIMQRVSLIDRMTRAIEQRDAGLARLGIMPATAKASDKPVDPLAAYINGKGK